MYLSRVEIDVNNRKNIKELNHLGAYHNWVERMFPEENISSERTRKLWRIDSLEGKKYLLILSVNKPDITRLEAYGVKNSAEVKKYLHFLEELKTGQILRFRITLNPVMSISTGKLSGERGRVVPHITKVQCMEYLKSRSIKNGFYIEDGEFYITESKYEILKKQGEKQVQISKVTYEGQLTIKDKNLFKEILVKGLGKKKAYGCGLMTVIPIKQQ